MEHCSSLEILTVNMAVVSLRRQSKLYQKVFWIFDNFVRLEYFKQKLFFLQNSFNNFRTFFPRTN